MVVQELQSLSDADVVDRVRAGETALYELLMRRYNQRLYRVIRGVLSDGPEGEDVLQDSWVRAYEHLDQFEGRASFATWVTRIAYYEALARSRAGKRWTAIENDQGEIMPEIDRRRTTDSPESSAIRGQLGDLLQASIDALPETYRAVFLLREVEQLSTLETGESLGLSEEAVKTRLHRGRAMLRRDLTERLGPALSGVHTFMGADCDRTVAAVLHRIEGRT